MHAEISSQQISQAALLLSLCCPPVDSNGQIANSSWLTIAIRRAKEAGAHKYNPVTGARHATQAERKRQNVLKRLWWCCMIRDRILCLAIQRHLQITPADFDFNASSPLEYLDLAEEVNVSKVYDKDTKCSLARLLERVVKLCIILTGLLDTKSCFEDTDRANEHTFAEDLQNTIECETRFRAWYTETEIQFPLASLNDWELDSAGQQRYPAIFGSNMYMLFQ
jgi:hypothetical protein